MRVKSVCRFTIFWDINHGEIVEPGTHCGLLEREGFYARLHNSHFRGDDELPR